MPANTNNYKTINADALKAEIFKKYRTLKEFNLSIFKSHSYISGVLHRGRISPGDIKLIEKITGIRPGKYVVDEPNDEQIVFTTPEAKQIEEGGGMVRNLDVDYIRFRAHELKLPLNVLCTLLGKSDGYLGNLRVNGAKRKDLDRLCVILNISPNDERLIKKDKTIEEAEPETVNTINNKIHSHESKIADLYTKIKKLEAENAEIKRQLEGSKRLAGSIVGSLAKEGIQVGKEKEAKQ